VLQFAHRVRQRLMKPGWTLGSVRLWALLIATVALCTLPAQAQTPQFNSFHTWADIATIKNYSDRFRYDGDYGIRGFITDRDWTQVYLRPSVRYRAKPWLTLHGGAALFYSFFEGEDLPELRPFIGTRFMTHLPAGWALTNYLRLEYRAFYLKSESDWAASFRGRWQLQVVSPRFEIASVKGFYGLASVEPFFDFKSDIEGTFGDRFRINFGMGRKISGNLRGELNYLFHQIRVPEEGGTLDLDDHVLRLRFFYTIR
jgi:hypothetical protein